MQTGHSASGRVALAFFVVALLAAALAGAASDKDRELKRLQSRIAKLNQQIQRDVTKRDSTLATLRDTESQIQAAAKKLTAIKTERESAEARLVLLQQQQVERKVALQEKKSGLAAQVRMAFLNGRQEQLKMLFNQEDPATVGRMTVYYRYLSDRRAVQVREVAGQLDELRVIARNVAGETANLKRLETQRAEELRALEQARAGRQAVLVEINTRLRASGSTVTRLKDEETRLVGLIRELEKLLKDFPVDSREAFASLKGELAWPVSGRLLADFGQPRAGRQIKWNGVLVGARRGDPVRAIARGRVAFSDWLPGLGLLVVLEHSDGFISLYGYNDTLTREAGEWLKAGDVLASVGDSGGQPRPALYFEIRRGKRPVNPHPWFRRSVAPRLR